MISQNRLEIEGKNERYLVDLTDSSSILKANGEICSTYLGKSLESGRRVVVKRYHSWIKTTPEYFWRVEREADAINACSQIQSELVYHEGVYYLIVDYVEGFSFKELTRWRYHRKLSFSDLISISIKALEALSRVHRAGFVHCDIKPSNIIVNSDDIKRVAYAEVKIIDFGMARKPAEPLHMGERKLPFGLIYSAPEQVLNLWELVSIQTDIYSIGVALWQLFTRVEPWMTDNPLKTIHIQLTQELPKNRRIPQGLEQVLKKATSKAKLARPPHMYTRTQLIDMLEHAIENRYKNVDQFLKEIVVLKKF
ncbi:serine/threonine protein kinase [Tenuifilum thalassicum]|uniref:Serine/threonine protein kinase n=1 Tax=Tenuifilum thalassicum TaxID=2590900 RepID=A0A7D4BJG2_9BACT|nr:serine/threonine-protein kinase [Tenuifilum thalassicum]QKG79559.1 serine/threonine protein kinase [Tenuifilum thalassicum]